MRLFSPETHAAIIAVFKDGHVIAMPSKSFSTVKADAEKAMGKELPDELVSAAVTIAMIAGPEEEPVFMLLVPKDGSTVESVTNDDVAAILKEYGDDVKELIDTINDMFGGDEE